MKSKWLFQLVILLASVSCFAGCHHQTKTIVLPSDERIFLVRDGVPTFDNVAYEWSEAEGWYVIAPGNVLAYLRWASQRDDEDESE